MVDRATAAESTPAESTGITRSDTELNSGRLPTLEGPNTSPRQSERSAPRTIPSPLEQLFGNELDQLALPALPNSKKDN